MDQSDSAPRGGDRAFRAADLGAASNAPPTRPVAFVLASVLPADEPQVLRDQTVIVEAELAGSRELAELGALLVRHRGHAPKADSRSRPSRLGSRSPQGPPVCTLRNA